MKKLFAFLLCVLMATLCVVPAVAASRQEVLDYAQEKIPAKYELYHIWAENILMQYDLTETQWDEVMAILVDLTADFPTDEGYSLHQYTKEHRAEAMAALNAFCDITNSSYVIRDVANPKHAGDQEVLLYNNEGTLVGTLDGDLYPDRTGETSSAWLLWTGVALLSASAVSVVLIRRRNSVA